MSRRLLVVLTTTLLGWLVASPALAHPLGNFTTNVHLGLQFRTDRLEALLVVDMAEIPAFREIPAIDTSADGSVSQEESLAYASTSCDAHRQNLVVRFDGRPIALSPTESSLTFPPGQGGLDTLRLECGYSAVTTLADGEITIDNLVFSERIGWAEIVVTDSQMALETDLPATSPSQALTDYPEGPPMAVRNGVVMVGSGTVERSASDQSVEGSSNGGVVSRLSALTSEAEGIVAVMAALGLGVAHALAPGHGKTLMAAYLVGRQGRPRQAILLGITVAISHTIGVGLLGLATLLASRSFQPDRIYPWLSGASAAIITAIGLAMLVKALRRHHHHHHHDHDPPHHHHDHDQVEISTGWRSLATLGLAGGMVPSASAVILLLAGISSGRPGFGLIMVACFGLGMSLALVGTGLAVLAAYRLSGRVFTSTRLHHYWQHLIPRMAGLAVTSAGLFLIWEQIRA